MNNIYRIRRAGRIKTADATLSRIVSEGLASANTPFSDIARLLDDMGVDTVLLEDPTSSDIALNCAKKAISAVSHAAVCLCIGDNRNGIHAATDLLLGVKRARIAVNAGNDASELNQLIEETKKNEIGLTVVFDISSDKAVENINRLSALGVDSFIISCKNEYILPDEVSDIFGSILSSITGTDISIYAAFSDSKGNSLANSTSAVNAGATGVVCAVGNLNICPIYEFSDLLMKRRDTIGMYCDINPRALQKASEILHIAVDPGYMPQNPCETADSPKISNRPALARRAVYLGYELDDVTLNAAYAKVRELSAKKTVVNDTDIRAIIYEVTSTGRYVLDSYQLQCGSGILSIAAVSVNDTQMNRKICSGYASCVSATGAIFSALTSENLFPEVKILSHSSQSTGEGTDTLVSAKVTLSVAGRTVTGHAFSYDTVTAAAKAFLSAVNTAKES